MEQRIARLAQSLPEEYDAALITSDINRRYFTGFPSSAGTLLVTRRESCLIVDSRYVEAAKEKARGCTVVLQEKLSEQLKDLLRRHEVKTLAIEGETMTIGAYQALCGQLPEVKIAFDTELSRLVNGLRRVKDKEELDKIAEAQRLTDAAFSAILSFIQAGRTEREIAWEIDSISFRLGADGPAFSTIVASGGNSSRPHAVPSEKAVQPGDFITMDFGAMLDGYCSDMTRTVALREVSARQKDVYETVLCAQKAALEEIRPGIPCNRVDRIARDFIDATCYKGAFGHGLGHSLGLEIHEPPNFNPACTDLTEPGLVMSVEPGIYLPGEFGVRIEDIIAVTGQGCHIFTTSPKELIIL